MAAPARSRKIERIGSDRVARVTKGWLFRTSAAFNFSNSPHSRGHVPMNHSDTFLRPWVVQSPVRPPDAIIARRFVRDLVRYHFTGLVAPIYYVSQIGRNNFSPTRSIILICSESSVFVIHRSCKYSFD